MVGGVILAAGRGTRMGGVPKALLEIEKRKFLEIVTETIKKAHCETIVVVLAPESREVLELARALGLTVAINNAPDEGMFSSVQAGVKTLLNVNPEIKFLIIFPVDHPFVKAKTIEALTKALEESPKHNAAIPLFEGRGGHPIVMRRELAKILLDESPRITLRNALEKSGVAALKISIADPAVLRNLNTPKDIESF
ncbi:MAG: hypothetical protein Kow0090_01730 [Myxococcota bacterium]